MLATGPAVASDVSAFYRIVRSLQYYPGGITTRSDFQVGAAFQGVIPLEQFKNTSEPFGAIDPCLRRAAFTRCVGGQQMAHRI